jgi:hypothetical protein
VSAYEAHNNRAYRCPVPRTGRQAVAHRRAAGGESCTDGNSCSGEYIAKVLGSINYKKEDIIKKMVSYLFALIIGLAFVMGPSKSALAEDFYKGKTLRFVVGFPPGAGYDTYARTVARHIGKYIPGNPTIVVQNMTGAGSLIAAHHIDKRAKPDG